MTTDLDLTLPAFLDRKLNGVKAERAPVFAQPAPNKAEPSDNLVRIYLANRIKGCPLGVGVHRVELVSKRLRQVARFRVPGRKNCVTLPVVTWLKLVQAGAKA